MSDDTASLLLALAAENIELRQQLIAAQELLIETAIDAGFLHSRIEALQGELAILRDERGHQDTDGNATGPSKWLQGRSSPHDGAEVRIR